MRSLNSIKNTIVSMIMSILTILIGLVVQKIFINILGTEYLGLNGLFNNVLSMLAIAELGIGSAIICSLYEPIANDDKEKIKSLMQFYKKSYRIIALVVTIIGICVIPFLNTIVGENNIRENITFIYLLFLFDTVASYLLTYKRSILYANQKTYVINIVHIIYLILMNLLQVVILICTQNYILYLIIKIVFRILENIVITFIANKMYPYIKEKNVEEIEKETKFGIIKKVKGLVFHKVASFVVNGTDNILISTFLGVGTVGLYSNYNTILQAVNTLFSQIFSSITASVGNLLVEKNNEKSYEIYKKMLFMNSWIYNFSAIAILCLMEPFIKIWIGEKYLLSFSVLVVITINFYIQGMRKTTITFKEAAGIFHEDRFVPVVESIINIIASIIFLKLFGLKGIFLGTITSTAILFFYSYPVFVYKKLFNRKYSEFLKEHGKYLLLSIILGIITVFITSKIKIYNNILKLIVNAIVVLIVPNLIQYIIFRNKDEFKYFSDMLKNVLLKFKREKNT
jgi:O-antigen/teichoic acid export membrane protein